MSSPAGPMRTCGYGGCVCVGAHLRVGVRYGGRVGMCTSSQKISWVGHAYVHHMYGRWARDTSPRASENNRAHTTHRNAVAAEASATTKQAARCVCVGVWVDGWVCDAASSARVSGWWTTRTEWDSLGWWEGCIATGGAHVADSSGEAKGHAIGGRIRADIPKICGAWWVGRW